MSPEVAPARAASPGRACGGASLVPRASNDVALARATICLINVERARHRLGRLRANATLERIALGQSADMVRGNYFADHSLAGRSPLQRIVPALYPARVATTGQNIGWGTGADATPAGIVRAWMLSPPHRRLILTAAFREAGVGVAASLPAVLETGTSGATYTLDLTAFANGSPTRGTSAPATHTSAPSRSSGGSPASERPPLTSTTSTPQELTAG